MPSTNAKYLFAFLLSLTLVTLRAQAPTESSLLWKIEGRNLSQPSYLYGTIHLICPNDFVLTDTLKGCLKQTEQLTLEIDMDDPGMMMAMMKGMAMQEGKQLKDLLDAKDYDRLNAYFKDSVGMSIAPFERAKPFMLMSVLLNRVLTCQPQSYEMSLMGLAKKQKVEVVGLETVEEQMAVFDSIPYADQAKMLVTLMDSLPQAREEFSKMVEVYKKQDIAGLYDMTLESVFELENQQEVLLTDRNKRWIPIIEKQVADKPTFIAVGAAHLGGEDGVIALLRRQGYSVSAIPGR
ncbi:TraB/GumN family protein [Persicitalea jodogahamensis]|uniref:Lipoprotein n=1 Tax=Persicitalea jodogahamensis TaxID=402147 RepID=A0A8J3G7I4_9BACT|nr:TraB/GumN family protein [Persicitalea jodogahamensis]GHB52856.1 lipoprotein [Persicitalea jodogahamensis]